MIQQRIWRKLIGESELLRNQRASWTSWAFCLWSLSRSIKKHSPRPWHSLQTDSRCFSTTYPLPLQTAQTISASRWAALMAQSNELP